MEVLEIEQGAGSENRVLEVSSPKGRSELILCEYWPEVVGINSSVVLIPLFGIDVPASSEGIRLRAELSGTETNDHIELEEEL